LSAPDALVANSQAGRNTAIELGIRPARVHVLPNAIDATPFAATRALRKPSSRVTVALIGQLIDDKRVDRFLDALAVARRTAPALVGIVVGDGPEQSALRARAERLGLLPEGVEFRGVCTDVPALLADVDILALTSDHEGLPNVILEAMAAGLPVVTTPAGDAGRVVQDGKTGYVVPFDHIQVLAERLIQLTGSPALRLAQGQAGTLAVASGYSPEGLSTRLLDIYRAVAMASGRSHLLERLEANAGNCMSLTGTA
jgi:glycosyltransferase involved in cell wall biosynthesis